MKMRLTLTLFALLLLAPATLLRAQDAPPAPTAPSVVPAPPAAAVFAAPAVPAIYGNDNFLGVHVEEVTRENMSGYGLSGEPRGVAVRRVVQGGPAERAGLREKDVIVRFDGEEVSSVRKLNRLIDESAPEHGARLTIRRGGAEQALTVKLGRRESFVQTFEGFDVAPFAGELFRRGEESRAQGEALGRRAEELRRRAEEMQRNHPDGVYSFAFGPGRRIGVSTSTLGKQLADYFGVAHGALVSSVEENSPAAKAGLKAGDIIIEAEGEQIKDAGDLSRVINRKEEGEVTLTVMRDKQRRTLKVTPERRQPQTFQFTPGAYAAPRIAAVRAAPRVAVVRPAAPRAAIAAPAPRALMQSPRPVVAPHFAIPAPRVLRMRPDRIIGERVL